MDKPLRSDLIEAWNRLVNHTCTAGDLALLLDSLKEDENLQEFDEVSDRVWNEAIANLSSLTEDRKEVYRKEFAQILAQHENKKKILIPSSTITRFRRIWYAAAAALLLGLLIPAVQFFTKPVETWHAASLHYINETTGRGEIKTITLPDETKVTLNAESRLTYPAVFANERSVELLGEAIFDVTHDSNRPFTVATADMNVKVLGTVFDVKAYPDDELLMVSVASGKVAVETWRAASSESDASTILLEKDRHLKINKTTGNHEKSTIDADKYLSWTDGILHFNDTPVREVINMLNRSCPQMVFELAEGEYPNLISGTLHTKKIETLFEPIMRTIGLKYKKTGNKITLYNDNENPN